MFFANFPGTIIAAELRHLLLSLGEKMKEDEVEEIIKLCSNEDTEGNTKYEGKLLRPCPAQCKQSGFAVFLARSQHSTY